MPVLLEKVKNESFFLLSIEISAAPVTDLTDPLGLNGIKPTSSSDVEILQWITGQEAVGENEEQIPSTSSILEG
jgi:hypothetical protein